MTTSDVSFLQEIKIAVTNSKQAMETSLMMCLNIFHGYCNALITVKIAVFSINCVFYSAASIEARRFSDKFSIIAK
jgi:hypothetical protein